MLSKYNPMSKEIQKDANRLGLIKNIKRRGVCR